MARDYERDEIDEWYENELYEAHEVLTKTCNKARDKYKKRLKEIQEEYTNKIKKYYRQ
jgi:predicted small metal-binding protein